jgi:hypothetical protein
MMMPAGLSQRLPQQMRRPATATSPAATRKRPEAGARLAQAAKPAAARAARPARPAKDGSGNDGKEQPDGAKSEGSKDAKDTKKDGASDDKPKSGSGDSGGDGSPGNADKPDEGSKDQPSAEGNNASTATPPTTGDQLSLCSRAEGDCNKGLACQSPAMGPFSPGRAYCSKICESDDDCSGLAPEGTKYTCSTGNGTHTCEIACEGADDKSCPSGLACTQTGRRRAAPSGDASNEDNAARGAAVTEPVFHCRYPFEVSKTWGACGDASHVCDEGLYCAAFWFGVGHCTHTCESDADCEKPSSGDTQPSCVTLVPAFGENPAVKQCALSCSAAAEDCPSGLACIQTRPTRPGSDDMESAPAQAWCL